MPAKRHSKTFRSSLVRVLICIAGSALSAKLITILMSHYVRVISHNSILLELIDTSLLVAILFPVFYFYIFLPLIHERSELEQSRKLLHNIISNIPFFVSWKDKNSVYLGCNEKFAEEVGIGKPENIVGKTDYDLVQKKEEAEFFVMCDKEVMEKDEPILNIEDPPLQYGTRSILLSSKVPLREHDGNIIGIIDIHTTIVTS